MARKYPVTEEMVQVANADDVHRIPSNEEQIETGQWYWIKEDEPADWERPFLTNEDEMLMCVVHIGSNYVQFKAPGNRSGFSRRVHLDKFDDECRRECSPEDYFNRKIDECRQRSKQLMLEVQKVTARLGVGQRVQLSSPEVEASTALVAVSGTENVVDYKNDLERAKKEELPALFDKIKKSNEMMATWMKAEVIPLEAKAGMLEEVVGKINDRIFHVEIYAGLTEEVVRVRDGEPAGIKEKLRVMQRRHYMDEECLARYRHGGMDFKDISAFDEWLAENENFNRILPFERCMVAFKVRRNTKKRPRRLETYLKLWYERYDTMTYMYVRNGEQLFRMATSLDFGHKIFPDTKEFDPKALMVKMSERYGMVSDFISIHDYEVRKEKEIRKRKENDELRRRRKEWEDAHPDAGYDDWPEELGGYFEPHRVHKFEFEKYQRFSSESVYFDDMNKELNDQLKEYNRISLVIQGLYDRSEVLHPHPPVQLWDGASFAQNIELVYDSDRVLTPGEKPDIQAYLERNRETFREGCMSIGQELAWLRREGKKETARLERSWREKSEYVEEYAPYGDPGPGYVAKITKLTRTGKATFRWERESRDWNRKYWQNDKIACTITVHIDELFCVDGYRLGDFRQFFEDPRTRADYLEWAPLLLAAEEYHAGKLKEGESDLEIGEDPRLRV